MATWIRLSRSILAVVGLVALLAALGNLLSGGAPITDPVMPGGVIFGLLVGGAAAWTMAPGTWRAAVVWLGLLAVVVALVVTWVNLGDIATRDLLVYVGVPSVIAVLATAGIAVGRVRAGAAGRA